MAIEAVHKLHPLEYSKSTKLLPYLAKTSDYQNLSRKVDKERLLQACLRQQKFVSNAKLENIRY
jgi:hypothetical protein